MRFHFCLEAESIGQEGAILPDGQPIKLQETRRDEWPYNNSTYKPAEPLPPHL